LLVDLFVCEACGTVDYWWGRQEVRLLPPGYLVGVLWLGLGGWWIKAQVNDADKGLSIELGV